MTIKTINLTSAEVAVTGLDGAHAWLRNDGTGTIYAGKAAGVSAGADGVVAVPAGGSAPVYGANGRVFLLGTGSVQLIGSDYSVNPFKTSAASGGSGADEVARAAIEAHAGNAEIHVTSAEKAAWDGKAELTDIPDKLPADGGNADTVDGKHASDFSQIINLGNTSTDTKTAIGIQYKTTAYWCSKWTDYPVELTDGQGMIIAVNYKGSGTTGTDNIWCRQLYISPMANSKIYQRIICGTGVGEWTNIADGGNAASVGAYTEAKIAALEARIAALEGGSTT